MNEAALWRQVCSKEALSCIRPESLKRWLAPARTMLNAKGVCLPAEDDPTVIDFARLADRLSAAIADDAGAEQRFPDQIRESLWVVGGLAHPDTLSELLCVQGVDDQLLTHKVDSGSEAAMLSLGRDALPLLLKGDRVAAKRLWLQKRESPDAVKPLLGLDQQTLRGLFTGDLATMEARLKEPVELLRHRLLCGGMDAADAVVWLSLVGLREQLKEIPDAACLANRLGLSKLRSKAKIKLHPANVAVWFWLKDWRPAIRIYIRHYGDKPGYHPVGEEVLKDDGREHAARAVMGDANQAFARWQTLKAQLKDGHTMSRADQLTFRAEMEALQEWFESLGHWRDLKPAAGISAAAGDAHADIQKQMEVVVAERGARTHVIEYDEVRMAHQSSEEGTEFESVAYNWEFFRNGASILIARTATGNDHPPLTKSPEHQYFRGTPPSGYSIHDSGGELKGTLFFPNGAHYAFEPYFGKANQFYPEELFQPGDYALRNVGIAGATLDALHADLKETKEITGTLRGAIANVEKSIVAMQPQLRGVPKILEDLTEARVIPEEATRKLFAKIHDVLLPEQQRIWEAVRTAGTQKAAIDRLREAKIYLSEATLSRRVHAIDEELAKHNLPPCKASGPSTRFTQSGGYSNEDGKPMPEELSQIENDWANDPASRDRTIQAYLSSSDQDKPIFHQTYYGIEDEAKEYRKRGGMKSP